MQALAYPERLPKEEQAMQTETPNSWIGTIVSHYRIVEQLGAGGMGVVFRAVDTSLDRQVALKFLPPEISHLREAKTRFIQEAKAASALDHPNICTIYEIGATDDGQLFIAMACYEGESLKQRIARGPLLVAETLDIMRQVASGLAESHEYDIIHRDIKPANVWITSSGQVKILDFGLAKVSGKTDLTRTGSSMGTPAYMSPEHARGEKVDHRTDLWSLGVLIYEALTGRVPFTGNSIPAVMYALLTREPAPLSKLCAAPPEVGRIVARLMRKQAAERYPTCRALLRDLAGVARPAESAPRSPTASAPPRWPVEVPPIRQPPREPRRMAMRRAARQDAAPPTPEAPTIKTVAVAQGRSLTETLERPAPARPASPAAASVETRFDRYLASGLEAALARSYDRAIEAFEKALEIRPGDSRAQFNLDRIRNLVEERRSGIRR
ncbi:MAG: protein kinase [Acidobacteriota bacterium]